MHNDVKQLLYSMAEGDERAYKTLFYMYYPRVRAFALGMLKNGDDADDLVDNRCCDYDSGGQFHQPRCH